MCALAILITKRPVHYARAVYVDEQGDTLHRTSNYRGMRIERSLEGSIG